MVLLPSIRDGLNPRIVCTTSCMHYIGKFDLENANKGGEKAYANNKLYFQTWLTELQYRLSRSANSRPISVIGVHPGYVQTNIWHSATSSLREKILIVLVKYFAIDAQQGSLAITNAATAEDCGLEARSSAPTGKEMYRNRIVSKSLIFILHLKESYSRMSNLNL